MALRILFLFLYLLLTALFYWNASIEGKTCYKHPFMVFLDEEMLEDREVKGTIAGYRKKLRRLFQGFLVFGLLFLFTKPFWILLLLLVLLPLLELVLPYRFAQRAREGLVKIKKERGWEARNERRGKAKRGEEEIGYKEEDYWRYGIFGLDYNNPYDPEALKENNSGGLNQTMNSARASIKWAKAGIGVFLLAIALFVGWQFAYPYYLDKKGALAELTLEEGRLLADSPLYQAEIPIEEILRAELTEELGEGTRTNGASTPSYGKGKFRYEKYGDVRLYAAWKHKPYLVLYTEKETYIVNDDDPETTKEIYKEIEKLCEARESGETDREKPAA